MGWGDTSQCDSRGTEGKGLPGTGWYVSGEAGVAGGGPLLDSGRIGVTGGPAWQWGDGSVKGRGQGSRTVRLALQIVLLHAVHGELVRGVGGWQRRRHEQQHGGQEDDKAERQARRLQHVLEHLARFLQHPGGRQAAKAAAADGDGKRPRLRGLSSAWAAAEVLRAEPRTARACPRVLRAALRPSLSVAPPSGKCSLFVSEPRFKRFRARWNAGSCRHTETRATASRKPWQSLRAEHSGSCSPTVSLPERSYGGQSTATKLIQAAKHR